MYYILTSTVENDTEDAILSGESIYLKRIECSFRDGVSLPAEDIMTPILFKIEQFALRGVMTDHLNLNDVRGPVFSRKVKELFEKAGSKNIQYFQLTLRDEFPEGVKNDELKENKKKKIVDYTDHFIANVIGLIDCVDHKNSVLDYFFPPELRDKEKEEGDEINNPFADENPNHIDSIIKLVFDETKIDPTLKIFRLKDQPNLLVFHESIVELIRKEKLSGFVFVPVAEYTDIIPDDDEEETKRDELKEDSKQKSASAKTTEVKQTEAPSEKKKGRTFLS
jgi:hypothetical protein